MPNYATLMPPLCHRYATPIWNGTKKSCSISGVFGQDRLQPSSRPDFRVRPDGGPVPAVVTRHPGQKNATPQEALEALPALEALEAFKALKALTALEVLEALEALKASEALKAFEGSS